MATQSELISHFSQQASSQMAYMAFDGVSFEHYNSWRDSFIKKASEVLSMRSRLLLQGVINDMWNSHTLLNIVSCYVRDGVFYSTNKKPVNGVDHSTEELHELGLTSQEWDQMGIVTMWRHTGTIELIGRTPTRSDDTTTRLSKEEFAAILADIMSKN